MRRSVFDSESTVRDRPPSVRRIRRSNRIPDAKNEMYSTTHSYRYALLATSILLSGCQELQIAAIRNDSSNIISVVAFDGKTTVIETGGTVGAKIEDCLSLLANGRIKHLIVPNPTGGPVTPADAYTKTRVTSAASGRRWVAHVVWLVFNDDGLFFNSPTNGLVSVQELDYQAVCPHFRQ